SGIRVNGVAPGPTDTGMLTRFTGTPEKKAALETGVPMGRLGLTEELANAIVFIASDEASVSTGHVLNVDGGKTAGRTHFPFTLHRPGLRPTPHQRAIHIKSREDSYGQRGEETHHLFRAGTED